MTSIENSSAALLLPSRVRSILSETCYFTSPSIPVAHFYGFTESAKTALLIVPRGENKVIVYRVSQGNNPNPIKYFGTNSSDFDPELWSWFLNHCESLWKEIA